MESEPNFKSYTHEELLEVYERIDKNAYPERFELVKALLRLSDNNEVLKESEIDPEMAEINKARRIDNFFNSLEENNSQHLSSDSGSDGLGGGGDSCGE